MLDCCRRLSYDSGHESVLLIKNPVFTLIFRTLAGNIFLLPGPADIPRPRPARPRPAARPRTPRPRPARAPSSPLSLSSSPSPLPTVGFLTLFVKEGIIGLTQNFKDILSICGRGKFGWKKTPHHLWKLFIIRQCEKSFEFSFWIRLLTAETVNTYLKLIRFW